MVFVEAKLLNAVHFLKIPAYLPVLAAVGKTLAVAVGKEVPALIKPMQVASSNAPRMPLSALMAVAWNAQ